MQIIIPSSVQKCISINASTDISTTSVNDVVANGMTLTPGAGSYAVYFNSQYSIQSGNVTGQAALDYTTAYNALMAIPATDMHLPVFGTGEVLTPGVYAVNSAGSVMGNLTLNAQGDANAVFIFRFSAAFSTAAGTNIILTNGASSSNIYWISEGAISLGASTTMKGTLWGHTGAVSLGAACNLNGRMFTNSGAINIDSSVISKPSSSYINIGILISFAMFTSLGNVTNTAASTVNGDIGTNSGTVSGFGTATVNGTIYLPGVDNNALATFSIYQNGVLISNSTRKRTLLLNTIDVTLHAIATILDGEAIDIRWKVDAGTVHLQNRILTLKSVAI